MANENQTSETGAVAEQQAQQTPQQQRNLQLQHLLHQETLVEMEMVTVADAKSFSQVQVKS